MSSHRPRPVRPRDAATLIVMRRTGTRLEVLLGLRARRHSFLPGFYVFPGGRLDAGDRRVNPARPLAEHALKRMSPAHAPALAQSLALAAVREAAEECGLLLGLPARQPMELPPGWQDFAEAGLSPSLDRLHYVGRAITPTDSPIRYHNRFFLVNARDVQGELKGSGELLDLGWREVGEAIALGLVDVTEFMLREAVSLCETGFGNRRPPLFGYRHGRTSIAYD